MLPAWGCLGQCACLILGRDAHRVVVEAINRRASHLTVRLGGGLASGGGAAPYCAALKKWHSGLVAQALGVADSVASMSLSRPVGSFARVDNQPHAGQRAGMRERSHEARKPPSRAPATTSER